MLTLPASPRPCGWGRRTSSRWTATSPTTRRTSRVSSPPSTRIPLDADPGNPADVVIGSRYVKGGKCVGWPFRRWLISRAGGIFIRFMLGTPVKDPTGGFKCFTRRALETLGDFSMIKSFGYSFQMEMNYRMWQSGMHLAEIPITFSERRAGASKITGSIAVESLKMVFKLKFGG